MSSITAESLADPRRVRRSELSERLLNAERSQAVALTANDKKAIEDAERALTAVREEIQAEYADEVTADTGKAK